MLIVNCAGPILNKQQLHRVKVLCKLPDSQCNVLKLLTYQNLVNYEIIPIGFKLGKLKGNKGKVLSKAGEEEKEESNLYSCLAFKLPSNRNSSHFTYFLIFSEMSKLAVGFNKPPSMSQQDKEKGILKEDSPKKRKYPEPTKETASSDFMGTARKFARSEKLSEKEQLKRLDEMLDVEGSWMADLPKRLSLPLQYIAEMVIKNQWKEVREKKRMEAMLASLGTSLFVSIYSLHTSVIIFFIYYFLLC